MSDFDHLVKFKDLLSEMIGYGIYNGVNNTYIYDMIDHFHQFDQNTTLDLDNLLILACYNSSDQNLIKKLLLLGANKEAMSLYNTTPVMLIAKRDWLEMFKYFVEIGSDIFPKDRNDAEHYAKNANKRQIYNFIQEIKSNNMKANMEFLKEKELILKKSEELENKVNFLMQQLATIQLNYESNDNRIRKKQKIIQTAMEIGIADS